MAFFFNNFEASAATHKDIVERKNERIYVPLEKSVQLLFHFPVWYRNAVAVSACLNAALPTKDENAPQKVYRTNKRSRTKFDRKILDYSRTGLSSQLSLIDLNIQYSKLMLRSIQFLHMKN